jgi:putative Mg2+ transporter-C (MgtC) family protein
LAKRVDGGIVCKNGMNGEWVSGAGFDGEYRLGEGQVYAGFLLAEIFPHVLDPSHVLRTVVRLVVAGILGGFIGLEREEEQKWAGLRTHMLVALGAALLVLLPEEMDMDASAVSRVIQGIVTGIGFIGGGVIFKLTQPPEVKGLTSAASIWVTAAVGVAAGLGAVWPAVLTVGSAWLILRTFQGWKHGSRAAGRDDRRARWPNRRRPGVCRRSARGNRPGSPRRQ